MKYKELGRTGLKVSVLGIGGGAFYGPNKTHEKVRKIIEYGVNHGVNFIETAEEYDETKIGNALKNVNKDLIIASKSCAHTPEIMETALNNSIKKIGKNIDIYMLQTVMTSDQLKTRIGNGTLDVLKHAKKNGKIKSIGITGHRISTLIEAIKTDEFDVVEVPYSIGQFKSEELFEVAEKYGVGVIAITPLAGGVLIDRDGNSDASDFMNAKNAIGYVISNNHVSTTLVGMSSIEHIKENIQVIDNYIDISQEDRRYIEEKVIEFLGDNFCRSCKACMPCSKYGWNFSIDNFLRFKTFYLKYGIDAFAEEYWKLDLKANECIECGGCINRCPYGVDIIQELNKTHKIFREKLDDVSKDIIGKINDKKDEIERTLKDLKGKIPPDLYDEMKQICDLNSVEKSLGEIFDMKKEEQIRDLRKILDQINEIKSKMDNLGGIRENIEKTRKVSELIDSVSRTIQEEGAKVFSHQDVLERINQIHESVCKVYKTKNIQDEEIIREYIRLNTLHQKAMMEKDSVQKGKMMDDVLMRNIKLLQKIKFLD